MHSAFLHVAIRKLFGIISSQSRKSKKKKCIDLNYYVIAPSKATLGSSCDFRRYG